MTPYNFREQELFLDMDCNTYTSNQFVVWAFSPPINDIYNVKADLFNIYQNEEREARIQGSQLIL